MATTDLLILGATHLCNHSFPRFAEVPQTKVSNQLGFGGVAHSFSGPQASDIGVTPPHLGIDDQFGIPSTPFGLLAGLRIVALRPLDLPG